VIWNATWGELLFRLSVVSKLKVTGITFHLLLIRFTTRSEYPEPRVPYFVLSFDSSHERDSLTCSLTIFFSFIQGWLWPGSGWNDRYGTGKATRFYVKSRLFPSPGSAPWIRINFTLLLLGRQDLLHLPILKVIYFTYFFKIKAIDTVLVSRDKKCKIKLLMWWQSFDLGQHWG
jgi:hypothetical protein